MSKLEDARGDPENLRIKRYLGNQRLQTAIAAQIPSGAHSSGELTDVDLTGLAVGEVLQWDGTNWVPVAAPGLSAFDPIDFVRNNYWYYNDFQGDPSKSADIVPIFSGTGAAVVGLTTGVELLGRQGIWKSSTGTTAAGIAGWKTPYTAFDMRLNTWVFEANLKVHTLSTSSERYQILIGFFDNPAGINQTNGIYFLYDEGGISTGSAASPNWQTVTVRGGTRTFTTTTQAARLFHDIFTININVQTPVVDWDINYADRTDHTTNIPDSNSNLLFYGAMMFKSVGTTNRDMTSDFVNVRHNFGSVRG